MGAMAETDLSTLNEGATTATQQHVSNFNEGI